MRVGDVVVVKGDNRLIGEIIAIDDWDRATISLDKSGVEVMLHLCDIDIVKIDLGCL